MVMELSWKMGQPSPNRPGGPIRTDGWFWNAQSAGLEREGAPYIEA